MGHTWYSRVSYYFAPLPVNLTVEKAKLIYPKYYKYTNFVLFLFWSRLVRQESTGIYYNFATTVVESAILTNFAFFPLM